MKSLTFYFHMKIKILEDFQICITIPLKTTQCRALLFLHTPYSFYPEGSPDDLFHVWDVQNTLRLLSLLFLRVSNFTLSSTSNPKNIKPEILFKTWAKT